MSEGIFPECNAPLEIESIEILASSQKGEKHLLTLKELYIRDIRPSLNTKDEFKQRRKG